LSGPPLELVPPEPSLELLPPLESLPPLPPFEPPPTAFKLPPIPASNPAGLPPESPAPDPELLPHADAASVHATSVATAQQRATGLSRSIVDRVCGFTIGLTNANDFTNDFTKALVAVAADPRVSFARSFIRQKVA
jgi:hypothetical protein